MINGCFQALLPHGSRPCIAPADLQPHAATSKVLNIEIQRDRPTGIHQQSTERTSTKVIVARSHTRATQKSAECGHCYVWRRMWEEALSAKHDAVGDKTKPMSGSAGKNGWRPKYTICRANMHRWQLDSLWACECGHSTQDIDDIRIQYTPLPTHTHTRTLWTI